MKITKDRLFFIFSWLVLLAVVVGVFFLISSNEIEDAQHRGHKKIMGKVKSTRITGGWESGTAVKLEDGSEFWGKPNIQSGDTVCSDEYEKYSFVYKCE